MNIFCKLGVHKWIGVHGHVGEYSGYNCALGCICVKCGFQPVYEENLPIVKNGKIVISNHELHTP